MGQKVEVSGTGYDIKGGKPLIGGTAYAIKKGRTLKDRTGYDIEFAIGETWVFKQTLSPPNTQSTYRQAGATMTTNGQVMELWITYMGWSSDSIYLYYGGDGIMWEGNPIYVYDGSSWVNQAYRTVTFSEPLIDSEFLTWLEANAVRQ